MYDCLSLCFSLRAERGGAVGVVWWCTEISEARWEIVSGALQVLTQHGNTHWCDTVTIASQQNIFHQRRYRQLQTERYEDRIKKGLNINGYEGWRVWKRKSPPPPTHQISPCPGQTRKYGFENTRKNIRNNIFVLFKWEKSEKWEITQARNGADWKNPFRQTRFVVFNYTLITWKRNLLLKSRLTIWWKINFELFYWTEPWTIIGTMNIN